MSISELTPRLRHQMAILGDAGYVLPENACVLDFGCGEGNALLSLREAGFDAYGCEIDIWDSPVSRQLRSSGYLREVPLSPYRLPFDNESFDLVLSNEVFEHVQDYPAVIAELARVMKPDAVALHLFPAKWIPIEPHVLVPFASVFRPYLWLLFWAVLGLRNPYQRGLTPTETAMRNFRYLKTHTNYPSSALIMKHFSASFSKVVYLEDLFIKNSVRGGKVYPALVRFPFLFRVYREFRNRVVLTVK